MTKCYELHNAAHHLAQGMVPYDTARLLRAYKADSDVEYVEQV